MLTDAQIASVGEIELSCGDMARLKGLEGFTALKRPICLSSNLKTLELLAGGALEAVAAGGNELERHDLSKTPEVCELRVDQNSLKALGLEALPELAVLSCRENGLKPLDLSHNPNLAELDCWGNKLETPDRPKNQKLVKLNRLEKPFKRLDFSKHQNLAGISLPARAQAILPSGDAVSMAGFQPARAAGDKCRPDLATHGAKTDAGTLEPEAKPSRASSSHPMGGTPSLPATFPVSEA